LRFPPEYPRIIARLPPAAPATAATATTTAAAAAAAAAAATAATAGTLLSFVHLEGSPVQLATVELLDRLLRLLIRAHLDEREAPRATRLAIHHDLHVCDGPDLPEGLAKAELSGVVRKIPDIETSTHWSFLLIPLR
jgi:hypothetical protein